MCKSLGRAFPFQWQSSKLGKMREAGSWTCPEPVEGCGMLDTGKREKESESGSPSVLRFEFSLLNFEFFMDQLIAATIMIADRTYRIKVQPKDEEVLRRTVKLVNDKVIEYKTQFAGKDMQDYIAMVLIWLATEQQSGGNNTAVIEEIDRKLQQLEKMIDSASSR